MAQTGIEHLVEKTFLNFGEILTISSRNENGPVEHLRR